MNKFKSIWSSIINLKNRLSRKGTGDGGVIVIESKGCLVGVQYTGGGGGSGARKKV